MDIRDFNRLTTSKSELKITYNSFASQPTSVRFDWLRRCRTTSMFITNFIQLCRPFKIQPLKLCYRSRFPHLQMKQADHWHFQLLFLLLQYNSLISKQKGGTKLHKIGTNQRLIGGILLELIFIFFIVIDPIIAIFTLFGM